MLSFSAAPTPQQVASHLVHKMSKAGLGFLNMLKTESQQVVVGTGAVSVAGALVYFAYLASSAQQLLTHDAAPAS